MPRIIENKDVITMYDRRKNRIEIKFVNNPAGEKENQDRYLYVQSEQKAKKEASMDEHFSQRYEEELANIKESLTKKGGTKKLLKVWERIGRLKERYPRANKHYEITVEADNKNDKAINIKWKRKELKPRSEHGVYFLRTSLKETKEQTIWTIYNTLREIESTFRVLKTDLNLRPVFHQKDYHTESHINLGVLAYQVVSTIRHQLKQRGINYDWQNIRRIMNTQKLVTTSMKSKNNKQIRIRKCSIPNFEVKEIYQALNLKQLPFYYKKSVVPEK